MTIALPYPIPAQTRMQRLREATRHAHTRIEGALPLLDPKLTRARYGVVLEAFFGFYVGLEPSLLIAAGAHAADIDLGGRAKLPLLLLDLHALGRTTAELDALPRCLELPLTFSSSHALGVLYVLEGATLGGQVIARNLNAALGLGASNGAAFFTGYGLETRAMWNRFCEHVECSAALDPDALVSAAVDTFEKLRIWLVTGTSHDARR